MALPFQETTFKRNFLKELKNTKAFFSFYKFVVSRAVNFIIEHYFSKIDDEEKEKKKKDLNLRLNIVIERFLKENKMNAK